MFDCTNEMTSYSIALLFPCIIVSINHALFITRQQSLLILRKTMNGFSEEYWRSEFERITTRRAIINMVVGMVCVVLYAIFLREEFLLSSAFTFFAYTMYYLYLIWQTNATYIQQVLETTGQSQPFTESTEPQKSSPETFETFDSYKSDFSDQSKDD